MYLLMVAVITMSAGLVYGQSSQCQKADGRSDECISLLKCKPLREQLDKPNKTDQDLFLLSKSLTELHCGSIRVPFVPKVCCPYPKTDQRINSPSPPPCNTPDGKPGKCINLFSCPHFKNLLQPPVPQEVISFVQSYRCVGPDEHSVCCGPDPTIPRSSCSALMTAFPPDRSSECCGVVHKRFGGLPSNILYQHPWAALIEYELKQGGTRRLCAGALINARYALTAAHCMTGQVLEMATPYKSSVRLGEYDLNHKGADCIPVDGAGEDCNDGSISIAIETIIPHPKYKPTSEQIDNNIALIRLKEAAPYTDFIRPICLPTKNPESSPPDSPLVAVSWFKDVDTKDTKMLVKVPFVDQKKCQKIYSTSHSIGKGEICAGGIEGMDTCKGDGGGPLVYENQGRSELIGTSSFGPTPCGQKDVPSVYTNVHEYVDWIKSHIIVG